MKFNQFDVDNLIKSDFTIYSGENTDWISIACSRSWIEKTIEPIGEI